MYENHSETGTIIASGITPVTENRSKLSQVFPKPGKKGLFNHTCVTFSPESDTGVVVSWNRQR